jgi:hypothetical protein
MVSEKADNAVEVATDWSTVTSWETALSILGADNITDAQEAFGDGSRLLDKKDFLHAEFVVLDWNYVKNKETGEDSYVNVLVINRQGSKARFNDGGSGIFKQCKEFEAKTGRRGGVYCKDGLRVSEFVTEDGQDAKTYYFA